jgi:hypothetical protein
MLSQRQTTLRLWPTSHPRRAHTQRHATSLLQMGQSFCVAILSSFEHFAVRLLISGFSPAASELGGES